MMAFGELCRRPPHGDPWPRRIVRGVGAAQHTSMREELAARLQRSVTTGRRVAVASVRGGAGKSTLTALVGSALSLHRDDRVLVVDGDPDLGSLSARLGVPQGASLRALFANGGQPAAFEELSPYLRQTRSGLWVLSGRREVGAPPPVDVRSFGHAQPVLSRYFAMSLVDCGAGLYGELTRSVLSRAHALLLVTQATVDGVRSARQALDQLAQTYYRPLLDRCVLALTAHAAGTGTDLPGATRLLSAHGVRVVPVPHDRHLAAGAPIDLHRIGQATRDAVLAIAAETLARSTA